jgi:hypothetical protein
MDVFSAYVEMTQNIRHYAVKHGYDENDSSSTVIVARHDEHHYVVQAGNLVENADGAALLQQIERLAKLDKVELKAAYKTQLRQPRDASAGSGAGLGLIDIARKSALPLSASLAAADDGRSFFSLRAVI